jgi:hypothetical protein
MVRINHFGTTQSAQGISTSRTRGATEGFAARTQGKNRFDSSKCRFGDSLGIPPSVALRGLDVDFLRFQIQGSDNIGINNEL